MAEGDRLGNLKMGKAGHYRFDLSLGQIEQAHGESDQFGLDLVKFVAQVQAQIRGDLVVT